MRRLVVGHIVLVASLVFLPIADATASMINISVATSGGDAWSTDDHGTPVHDQVYDFEGAHADGAWSLEWDIEADADPFVSGSFGVTNTSLSTQTFAVSFLLPIAPPVTPASLVGGSTGGSVTDGNFNGAGGLSTVPGVPLYQAKLDGVQFAAMDIYPDPTTVPAGLAFLFPGQTVTIPAINKGLPGPSIPGPAVLTSIEIEHNFTLSPGDNASFTSFLVVEVVPEPATLGLLGVGMLGLMRRRRIR